MMKQNKKFAVVQHYFLYDFYDVAREKGHSFITLFFCVLSMMEQEKKLILFKHYIFYFVYDGAREKSHSFITLFFLCCVW